MSNLISQNIESESTVVVTNQNNQILFPPDLSLVLLKNNYQKIVLFWQQKYS